MPTSLVPFLFGDKKGTEKPRRELRGWKLEMIIIREVFHDIFHTALEDIAQAIDGVHFHILILTQAIYLGTVDIMVGIQIVLCNSAVFHCLP